MNPNSRRKFLQGSITAAASLVAAPILRSEPVNVAVDSLAEKPGDSRANKISILSYSFLGLFESGQMDLFGYLESCRYRYNLAAANIWNSFFLNTSEDYLKKVKDAMDERELTLACLTCDDCHIWDPDPTERKKYYANAMAHLKAGKILGAKFVRIDAGGPSEGDRTSPAAKEWSNEAFDGIVKRYKEYAQYASDNGFKMGPENHWGPEGIWANMQKLYKAMDNHPGFGLSVHMSQWQGTKEEKDLADRESAPWVVAVHFDNRTCEGPLAEKMTLLKNAGYNGYWVVENHSHKVNEYASVAIELAHVRAVLQRWRTGETGTPAQMRT